MISQLSLLEKLDTNLNEQAKQHIADLRKRLEANKQTLQSSSASQELETKIKSNEDSQLKKPENNTSNPPEQKDSQSNAQTTAPTSNNSNLSLF